MNVMDRGLPVETNRVTAKRKRPRRLALAVLAGLIVAAVAFYVLWAFTLCGDCGAPTAFPPPAI